jgi:hypothetical protein
MTVNERLFVTGLDDQWNHAVARGDREKLAEIASQIELVDQADVIIEAALGRWADRHRR